MGFEEKLLRRACDKAFDHFDKDGSGALDSSEATSFINCALDHMGVGFQAEAGYVNYLIQTVDRNHDGQVQKEEMFQIFKMVIEQVQNGYQGSMTN